MGFNREYIINVAPSSKSCSNHNNCRNLTGRSVMTEGERERVTECWCHAARSWLGSDWSSAWPSAFHITLRQHQLLLTGNCWNVSSLCNQGMVWTCTHILHGRHEREESLQSIHQHHDTFYVYRISVCRCEDYQLIWLSGPDENI